MTGERPGAWPEWEVATVAGVGRLSGSWWPGSTVGWAIPRQGLLRSGHATASSLFVGPYTAILSVAVEGRVGLTEVLAAVVAARTWVGLDISG